MTGQSGIEKRFDIAFAASLAQREKQIQQNYRPIIGIHKWFARRPGSLFRNLLIAEFGKNGAIQEEYWQAHDLRGVIADPFMGGGTPILEANRLGFDVVGTDINPMAFWIVHQSLAPLNLDAFAERARAVVADVESEIGNLYTTKCDLCGGRATVKYFIWVKVVTCPTCETENDLFPGYLLAQAERHPRNVVMCSHCGHLNEYEVQPTQAEPALCQCCKSSVFVEGVAHHNKVTCRNCQTIISYPERSSNLPPHHRMWAIEYYCEPCKPNHAGRFFKRPDPADLDLFARASAQLARLMPQLCIPETEIPEGDETQRLRRWGYTHFRQLFNERQLLGLGLVLGRISQEQEASTRHALLTVFSDFSRYQNMLCRYDTYALKCQDIFSVHGFPVGLIQCEANLLGIPRVGSGGFRHFVEKYRRAKEYCQSPFETRVTGKRKQVVPIAGERIEADFTQGFPTGIGRQAWIRAANATDLPLPPNSLDGVFTDPPYFDNVQYAELMDFCFAWLRLGLKSDFAAFQITTTRTLSELTGNITLGRGLEHFTEGLSKVFTHYAAALKPAAPFVFTFHHNDPVAYVPLVVAVLDAGLDCTASLPAPAEMEASLHIAGANSSVLDTVFVCRRAKSPDCKETIQELLARDLAAIKAAGLDVTGADARCLLAGHIVHKTINQLWPSWDTHQPLLEKISIAKRTVMAIGKDIQIPIVTGNRNKKQSSTEQGGIIGKAL